jgi:hypothetical protein
MSCLRETLMNLDFFLLLPIACLIIIGIWNAFAPGEIFGWLGKIWDRRLPEALSKPIYACPPCMASVHGTWVWILAGGQIEWWIPFILALSGLNRLVSGKLL